MTEKKKWNYLQLSARMRLAGWSPAGPGRWEFHYRDGRVKKIDLYDWDMSQEVPEQIWHGYAKENITPDPTL